MYLMFLHISPIQSSPGLFALWNIKSGFSHLFCEKRKLAVGVSEEHELVLAETCGGIDVGSTVRWEQGEEGRLETCIQEAEGVQSLVERALRFLTAG